MDCPREPLVSLPKMSNEAGRACSRPRQWKHGHERARLTVNTGQTPRRLQDFFLSIFWGQKAVSSHIRDLRFEI
jgi:hypothetical protein